MSYSSYPFGDFHWKSPVTTLAALPTSANSPADVRVTLDTFIAYVWNGSAWQPLSAGGGGSGTVTSVGLTLPVSVFTVTGSPITTAGTLVGSLNTQTANTVWAGPTSGGALTPTFRALVAADLPVGTGTVTSVAMTVPSILSVSGSPITTNGTFALTLTTETANTFFAGPTSGGAATPTFRAITSTDLPAGTGTVTSVAMTVPSILSVSGSPVTTSGTLAVSLTTETANFVFAGPTTGSAAAPTFRALVAADLPAGTGTGTVTSVAMTVPSFLSVSGSPITTSGTLAVTLATETANTVFAGPTTGSAAAPTFRTLVVADIPSLSSLYLSLSGGTITGNLSLSGTLTLSGYTAHTVLVAEAGSAVVGIGPGTTGQVLQSGGASADPTYTSTLSSTVQGNITTLGTITSGTWNGTVTAGTSFITSGTIYTTPAGITAATLFNFILIGGGAGGSSANSASTHSTGGGAGGGVSLFITGLSPSTGYTIAIGAAGAGGAAGAVGNAGGNTTLTIGATTYTASGGGAAAATTGVGGVGGTGTNGTINVNGMNGGPSMAIFTSGGMPGGNAPFGYGMGGSGNAPSVAANGQNATGFGGGGGGESGNGGFTGGNGTQGMIFVKWDN